MATPTATESDVVLVDGARTPHGTLLGSLADVERGVVGMSIGGGAILGPLEAC